MMETGRSAGGRRTMRVWLARGLLLAALTWMSLLVMVPFALAHESGGRAATVVSAGTYLMGSIICHQRPDRSFRLWDVQMPVCARCAGLYAGAVLGAIVAGAGRVRSGPARAAAALRSIVVGAGLPTGITLAVETLGVLPVGGGVRALAAIPLGAAVAWVASLVIRGELA